ncbi:MAG TPA: hypothetical protein PKY59_16020 [Pyrinomonadaceae bacterium]|nr:hypothetical protein [Pyrinomonadaceae bacterium]
MFIIKSNYSRKIEINSGIERVRAFFSNTLNFIKLMDGVESIIALSDTKSRWTIRVDFPIIGAFKQEFIVEQTSDDEDFIEWSPINGEAKNFLRYSADLVSESENKSSLMLMLSVELRREKASQLHFLAGMAGAETISTEMSKYISKMLDIFLEEAKTQLEN